jgi:hypothetical protein
METTAPVRRVALIGLLTLALWGALAAPKLERSAASAPLGTWRNVQLALLAPFQRGSRPAPAPAAEPIAALELPPLSELPPVPAILAPTARPGLRQPTAADPLRVLIIGDSLGKDFAYGFATVVAADPTVAVTTDARPATGLSRPDYFDWPAQLARDVANDRPELVIVMLGGDDAQPFEVDGHPVAQGSAEWRTVYAARVSAFMRTAASGGRVVLWLGLPIMGDEVFSARMRDLNAIYAAAAERERVRFVETWTLFADAAGRYAPFLRDESGRMEAVRQLDGIHFSVAGALRIGAYARKLVADEISSSSARRSWP